MLRNIFATLHENHHHLCTTTMKQLSTPGEEQSESPQHLRNNHNHPERTKEFGLKMGLQHQEE